jgi:hypothetical protein
MHIISQALNPPGESIDSKLPLEGPIGHATALAQQGQHLVYHRDKVHPRLLPAWCSASISMQASIIA